MRIFDAKPLVTAIGAAEKWRYNYGHFCIYGGCCSGETGERRREACGGMGSLCFHDGVKLTQRVRACLFPYRRLQPLVDPYFESARPAKAISQAPLPNGCNGGSMGLGPKMMTTHIALLRAINVGGRDVGMERLRALFAELGLANVRSYIQTGNVFFEAPARQMAGLTAKIEKHLSFALKYEVSVFLRTLPDLESALAAAPFRGKEPAPHERHLVMFLSAPIPGTVTLPHCSPKGYCELLHASGSEAFVVIRVEKGKVPNATAFLEKTFGLKCTARMYHTCLKILEAAKFKPDKN
ncbi:MAG: DUF1697 domain-containing protein [Candidatus Sumerlaeaceae bacterium]|nr:DUF1697 domain-containing protein [Candidatus Sumerlaeaceae bacterium]